MKIDISRVNLLEKDIEDWLYENPGSMPSGNFSGAITKWIGRQYAMPSGIADLIGVRENGMVVVVEIKNVPINKAAVLQVCRYQNDLKYIIDERMDYLHMTTSHEPLVEMVLIGPSIDGQTFAEAQAVGVMVYRFGVSFTLEVDKLDWDDEHWKRIREQHSEIAARPEWDIFGTTCAEHYEQYMKEQAQREEEELKSIFSVANTTVSQLDFAVSDDGEPIVEE